MLFIRYGIGAIMVVGGAIMLIVSPAGLGVDGFAMAVGGGLSVLLLNYMYRLSVASEDDRAREEEARAYFDEHGEPGAVARYALETISSMSETSSVTSSPTR